MECPICLDTMKTTYFLKSCSHSVCMKCYRQLKNTSPTLYPFGVDTVKVVPIQCPLCRKKEDIELKPEEYPVEYKQWLELVMHEQDGLSWYTVETNSPPMKEWRTYLKYASTKIGRHGFKRIRRSSVY